MKNYDKPFLVVIIPILCILISCTSKENKIKLSESFDVNDYELKITKRDSSGLKTLEVYGHKLKNGRYLTKTFWENGTLQSLIFYNNRVKSGPFKMYDLDGTISFECFYYLGKLNGPQIFYKHGEVVDFEMSYDNNQLDLDSEKKKAILEPLTN